MKLRWEPFHEFETFRRQVDRMFNGFGAGFSRLLPAPISRAFPQVNLSEDEEKVYVEATAPGIDPESVEVTVERDTLTIAGERKGEKDDDESRTWHMKERWSGAFTRTIRLPVEIDAEKVSAEYADGVLRITLHKAEAAKPRQIEVKHR